ncbi:MAG TPA: CinA family protein [Caulobacterales bacterium]|nr:CinA family protein [Caulobacterales bacterium]
MFPEHLNQAARDFLSAAQQRNLRLATAESCTGGLIAACVCEIPGCSATLERGFVVYSNDAKTEMLGVPKQLIQLKGAVSAEVARAMAEGALAHSRADLAIAVTGIAGPDGGSAEKPVGLVHFGAARKGRDTLHEEHRFGDLGRLNVQAESVATAFRLLMRLLA